MKICASEQEPSELVVSIYKSQHGNGEEALMVVMVEAAWLWGLPDIHMLSIKGSNCMEDGSPVPEFNIQLLPLLWGSGTAKYSCMNSATGKMNFGTVSLASSELVVD